MRRTEIERNREKKKRVSRLEERNAGRHANLRGSRGGWRGWAG